MPLDAFVSRLVNTLENLGEEGLARLRVSLKATAQRAQLRVGLGEVRLDVREVLGVWLHVVGK